MKIFLSSLRVGEMRAPFWVLPQPTAKRDWPAIFWSTAFLAGRQPGEIFSTFKETVSVVSSWAFHLWRGMSDLQRYPLNLCPEQCWGRFTVYTVLSVLVYTRAVSWHLISHDIIRISMKSLIKQRFTGYHCKSDIPFYKWKDTWNYAYCTTCKQKLSKEFKNLKTSKRFLAVKLR